MKIIVPGHKYELLNAAGTRAIETLSFVNKQHKPEVDGTTNEEVLAVLIDRMQHLDKAVPCKENKEALKHLKATLAVLEKRTVDRKARGVEGTDSK